MAITYTFGVNAGDKAAGPLCMDRITFAIGGDNYATNGLACDPVANLAQLTGKTVVGIAVLGGGGYVGEYDHTNEKLKVFYADYDAVADGALIEYPDATALTASFQLLVFSY